MPDIVFKCRSCGKHLVVDEAGAGVKIDCPDCKTPLTIPTAGSPACCWSCGYVLAVALSLADEELNCPNCKIALPAIVKSRAIPLGEPSQRPSQARPTAKPETLCPSCKKGTDPKARFCAHCGEKLRPDATDRPPESPARPPKQKKFNYLAMNSEGQEVSGAINAENQQVALQKLRDSGLFPISFREESQQPPSSAPSQGAEATEKSKVSTCPQCGEQNRIGRVDCLKCGVDLKTGRSSSRNNSVSLPAAVERSMGSILFGVLVGAIYGAMWAMVFGNHNLGLMALIFAVGCIVGTFVGYQGWGEVLGLVGAGAIFVVFNIKGCRDDLSKSVKWVTLAYSSDKQSTTTAPPASPVHSTANTIQGRIGSSTGQQSDAASVASKSHSDISKCNDALKNYIGSRLISDTSADFGICNCYISVWRDAVERNTSVGYDIEEVQKKYMNGIGCENLFILSLDPERPKRRKELQEATLDSMKSRARLVNTFCSSEQAKALALEAVAIFAEIRELADQPKGSLITFSKAVQDLETRRTRCINQIEAF